MPSWHRKLVQRCLRHEVQEMTPYPPLKRRAIFEAVPTGPDFVKPTRDESKVSPAHSAADVWSCTIFHPSGNFRNTRVKIPCGVFPSGIVK